MGRVEKVIHTCESQFSRSGHPNTLSWETTNKACAYNYTVICPYSFRKQSRQHSPIHRYDRSKERASFILLIITKQRTSGGLVWSNVAPANENMFEIIHMKDSHNIRIKTFCTPLRLICGVLRVWTYYTIHIPLL